jgi:hypothetical protein
MHHKGARCVFGVVLNSKPEKQTKNLNKKHNSENREKEKKVNRKKREKDLPGRRHWGAAQHRGPRMTQPRYRFGTRQDPPM